MFLSYKYNFTIQIVQISLSQGVNKMTAQNLYIRVDTVKKLCHIIGDNSGYNKMAQDSRFKIQKTFIRHKSISYCI